MKSDITKTALSLMVIAGAMAVAPAAFADPTPYDDHDRRGIQSGYSAGPMVYYDAEELVLSNGLRVKLYGSDALTARMTHYDGDVIIPIDNNRYVSVITDINDPSIYNRGDGRFHAFDRDMVIGALEAIDHPAMSMEVTVYLLPFPRRNLLVSSTSGNEIFLSPHVLDIHEMVCAYIVAHEVGHAFHNRYMPDNSRMWTLYRGVRGITDEIRFADSSAHSYQPKEIFAEDFRVLFGGSLAAFGGRIENPELAMPASVAGLERFMHSIGTTLTADEPEVAASSYPNPFNPDTQIRVRVPDAVMAGPIPVRVRVYNVRGALVRELFNSVTSSRDLTLRWDGRDNHGNPVASSNYYALVQAGEARTTVKLVLLK